MWSCVLICGQVWSGGQVCRWFDQVGWRWRLRVGCRRRGRSRRAGGDSFQLCFDWQHDDVVLRLIRINWSCFDWQHCLGDRLEPAGFENTTRLETGWWKKLKNVFGKFLKTQHCWQTGASEKFFLLEIFEDSYCSWWVGELVGWWPCEQQISIKQYHLDLFLSSN